VVLVCGATRPAIDAATDAATYAATDDATRAAISAAARAAIDATDAATRATHDATDDAATRAATDAATRAATDDAMREEAFEAGAARACLHLAGAEGLSRAGRWEPAYQGGNMWAPYDAWLTAARDILGLKLPEHDNYAFWEQAAIHGGFRVMHEKFCIVSDFPEVLKKDDQNRPHCGDGPSHRWRDGWSLYHWHGVRIPAEWIEDKKSLTAAVALGQVNAEFRRAACEILGWAAILSELNARVLDRDDDPEIGALVEVNLPEIGRERFLRVRCGTGREFAIPVPPGMKTALQAQAWTWGLDEKNFIKPEVRT
jgi:hypothetical protein